MIHFINILTTRSSKWSLLRRQHLIKQPNCQACGSSKNLHVHHIEPVHVNPDRELDPENLITLCSKYCHLSIGHLMDYKSWNNNVKEDAMVYYNKVLNRPFKIEVQKYEKLAIYGHIMYIIRNLFWWNNRS